MDVLKACKTYFSPSKLIEASQKKGGWKTVRAGLVLSSYVFIIPPFIMGLLYGGAYAVRSLSGDDPSSKKIKKVGNTNILKKSETDAAKAIGLTSPNNGLSGQIASKGQSVKSDKVNDLKPMPPAADAEIRSEKAEIRFDLAKEATIQHLKLINPTDDIKNLTIDKLTDHFTNNFSGLGDDYITYCLNLAYRLVDHPGNPKLLSYVVNFCPYVIRGDDKSIKLNIDGVKYLNFIFAVIAFSSSATSNADLYENNVRNSLWIEKFNDVLKFFRLFAWIVR